MTGRRSYIKPLRPLIVPALLSVLVFGLIIAIKPLGGVDQAITSAIDALPSNLTPLATAISYLGSVPVLVGAAVGMALVELLRRHPVRASIVMLSLTSLLAFLAVKMTVRRARPVTEFVASHGLHDFSFPSGHAAGSAGVYGAIALVLWTSSRRQAVRALSIGLIILIILIGISRVYLGAHYPTDVLGGWLVALIIISLLRSLSLALAKRSPRSTSEAIEDTTEAKPAS